MDAFWFYEEGSWLKFMRRLLKIIHLEIRLYSIDGCIIARKLGLLWCDVRGRLGDNIIEFGAMLTDLHDDRDFGQLQ